MTFTTAKEVEECILFIVAMLGDNAYPAKVTAELSERTSTTISVAAVHSILDRFERDGVLTSSSVREVVKSRRKRVYALTEYGRSVKNIPYLPETLKELLRLSKVSGNDVESIL